MKVFLSHQHGDKPVVEPIAIALKDKLGEANVFYDSWSIKPGEGIIDRMNEGMTAPDFVFFFVSENSLARGCYGLGGVSDSSGIG
ncbi:toll/interleukin-1 receptor domain-containing protein [Sphingomonas sp. 2378]